MYAAALVASPNVAKGKTGSASSVQNGEVALALDGGRGGECFQTGREHKAWYSVDLGNLYPIVTIRLTTGHSYGMCVPYYTGVVSQYSLVKNIGIIHQKLKSKITLK